MPVLSNTTLNCPPNASYSPCQCDEYNPENVTDGIRISLDCSRHLLTDSKVSEILDSFLQPGVDPLGKMDLSFNKLTTVPDQMKFFPKLDYVSLFNNEIRSIQSSGAFNFLKTLTWLYLDNNQLASIAPGAFQGLI